MEKPNLDPEDIAIMEAMNLTLGELIQLDAFCVGRPTFTSHSALMSEWIRLKALVWQKRNDNNAMLCNAYFYRLDQGLLTHGNAMVRWELDGDMETEEIEA